MNILITTGIYPPDVGGPAKFVPLISKHLSNENEVRIITLSEDTKLNQDEKNQVHRIKRNQNKIIRFLKTVFSIIKFGKNVEVIFVNGLWLEVYIANLVLRKKIVRKIVGDPVWEKLFTQNKIFDSFDTFQKNTYNFKVQLYKYIRNIVIRSANIIIVPSNHLYEFVKNINFSGELIKINNGTLITDALEKNFKETNFLIVSRLVKHKNIDLIIKSLYNLKNKYSLDFNLDIVGEGPDRSKLNNLINHLNLNSCVNLVGSKHGEDLENFYKNSNYFLQISSYEGMPHTILEAMNHKLVIIASNFGGNYELIGENIYGYLVESIKENEIVKAIKVAVDDIDKESKVIKAKEMIEKEYNIESTIKSYSEIILKNDKK